MNKIIIHGFLTIVSIIGATHSFGEMYKTDKKPQTTPQTPSAPQQQSTAPSSIMPGWVQTTQPGTGQQVYVPFAGNMDGSTTQPSQKAPEIIMNNNNYSIKK